MKIITLIIGILFTMSSCVCTQGVKELNAESTPQEVLDALMAGNKRFAEGSSTAHHRNMEYVQELNSGQHPLATVIACSDSRVPVELLFDEGFGDIFVVRTAGNTILDDLSLGSVDYSLNHLGVKVIIFLGHTNCGAITSVVQMGHDHHEYNNDDEVVCMVQMIAGSLEQHRGTNSNIDQAVKDNVLNQTALYVNRPFIKKRIESGELMVIPAIYNLACGRVQIIE